MVTHRSFKYLISLTILSSIGSGCSGNTSATKSATATTASTATNPTPALALPSKIDRLVNIVPEDAVIVTYIQPKGLFAPDLGGKTPTLSRQTVAAALSEASGLPTSFTGELLGSLEEAVFFSKVNADERDESPLKTSCIGAKFQNEQNFDSLIEQISAKRQSDGRIVSTREGMQIHGAWVQNARIAIMCTTAEAFSASLRAAKSDEPSFSTSKRFRGVHENDTWASVDLYQITQGGEGAFEPGSHVFATIPRSGDGTVDLSFVGRGNGFPRLAELFVATNHVTLTQFPQGAAAVFGLSLERMKGKTITDFMREIERVGGPELGNAATRALSRFGTNLGNIDAALGNEIAVGVYADAKFAMGPAEPRKHKGILIAIPTANDTATKKVLQSILNAVKKRSDKQGSTFTAESMSEDLGDDNQLRVERKNGVVLISVGDKKFIAELVDKFGKAKESLAANADFEQARNAAKPSHLMGFVDANAISAMAGGGFNENPLGLSQTKPKLMTITFQPLDRGMGVDVHSYASTMGFASAVAIFGVNRYLKNAKVAEAKNIVGNICRGAVEGYEREGPTGDHVLCKSAIAVPSRIPMARKYMPVTTDGEDFNSGGKLHGWRCLRIKVESPIYYQYEYRVGGDYKGPARGGPDPGPNGFEVSAEGDLDGDGKTSLFTLTGVVENDTMKRATQIFIVDEFE